MRQRGAKIFCLRLCLLCSVVLCCEPALSAAASADGVTADKDFVYLIQVQVRLVHAKEMRVHVSLFVYLSVCARACIFPSSPCMCVCACANARAPALDYSAIMHAASIYARLRPNALAADIGGTNVAHQPLNTNI